MADDDSLARWLADARVDAAADERARVRRLLDQAGEDATLTATLVTLAERREAVSVRTASGTTHHGVVRAVGRDVAVIETSGRAVLVALDSLTLVRVAGRASAPAPDQRRFTRDISLAALLAAIASDRPRVSIGLRGGDNVAGELRGVGTDIAVVAADTAEAATFYVALASVVEVSVFACG